MSKDEFYVKLNDIVNFAYNLGETYDDLKIFRKILRSLTEDFRLEVTVIIESKDINTILVEELVGSLWTYELDFPKTSKQKSTAFKIVDETNSFDGELCSSDVAYLAKQFKRFMKNSK